jgi:hypothetical protein
LACCNYCRLLALSLSPSGSGKITLLHFVTKSLNSGTKSIKLVSLLSGAAVGADVSLRQWQDSPYNHNVSLHVSSDCM